ncbi:hypothetical protein CGZ94_00085 [Enemella evansiae]|uniref:Uncharacterized protein n=1 Tax=Enemella evansiae TaxID=2016499 RepID=A0A255GP48_9ACTN|nr:hypothetical protein CGZ94_00085 [Enemella evansiae]
MQATSTPTAPQSLCRNTIGGPPAVGSHRSPHSTIVFEVHTVVGFEPRSVGSLVRAVLDRRAGRIDDADLPAAAGFRLSADGHPPVVTYFAVGTKR